MTATVHDIEAHRARLGARSFDDWPTLEAVDGEVVIRLVGPVSPAMARYIARVLPTVAASADAQRRESEGRR